MVEGSRADTPICPYCNEAAELVTGISIYGNRPDIAGLGDKRFWRCVPCRAYVGCHSGTTNPLGRLADAQLRHEKIKAHNAFDALWRRKIAKERCSKGHARRAAYKWLASQLGIPKDDCHIGMFDVEMCRRVVDVCMRYHARKIA